MIKLRPPPDQIKGLNNGIQIQLFVLYDFYSVRFYTNTQGIGTSRIL